MPLFRIERAVVGSLIDLIGGLTTVGVLVRVIRGHLSYYPFKTLGKPADDGEKLARAHVRDALILYRALTRSKVAKAHAVFERAMTVGAQTFLQGAIGVIDRQAYQDSTQSQRTNWIEGLIALFPNATATIVETSDTKVAFSVTRCRYVELALLAGHPEIASTFCAGDAAFFESQPAGIAFNRSVSIAEGESHCPFELTLIQDDTG